MKTLNLALSVLLAVLAAAPVMAGGGQDIRIAVTIGILCDAHQPAALISIPYFVFVIAVCIQFPAFQIPLTVVIPLQVPSAVCIPIFPALR